MASRKMTAETMQKTAAEMSKIGLDASRIEMPADFVKYTTYNDDLRECLIGGWLPIRFVSEDKGVTWKGAFPMIGVTNASGSKTQTAGYVTEKAGPWDTRTDHLSLSFGRQLVCSVPELLSSTDKTTTSLVVENDELKSKNTVLEVSQVVMDMLYDDEYEGERAVTLAMWEMIPQKLQTRVMMLHPEYVAADVTTYADGNPVERDADEAPEVEAPAESPAPVKSKKS